MDAVADLMNALCPAVAQLACVIESTSGSPLFARDLVGETGRRSRTGRAHAYR